MYKLFRFVLFQFDAEKVHYFVVGLLNQIHRFAPARQLFRSLYVVQHPALEINFLGLKFPNPVGLAAGFDKNAQHIDALADCGFGFIEIGTVTPKAQPGNDKPRLFRLKADQAILNRMGFNNDGVEAAIAQLKARHNRQIIIGGNIGKNKWTPNEEAANDYLTCFEALFPYVDYFVVNVSSPNTPNLRALQEKEPLQDLLLRLQELNKQQSQPKPILLKIAPDLSNSQIDEIIEIVTYTKIAGLIVANTTISREGLRTPAAQIEQMGAGGISGKPVTLRATEMVKYIHEQSNGKIPMMAVGGIHTAQDALDKLAAGATLVQLYTGFIYEGPALVKAINRALLQRVQK
ncbi:MAG: quinone-dependent dihydroorotate dehydrogenase [Cryomorphaceae bacterium]|nr:quinone-dependent dihydroorotate dehydrogenase [Cryomorphaceae bacterium]